MLLVETILQEKQDKHTLQQIILFLSLGSETADKMKCGCVLKWTTEKKEMGP